MTQASQSRVADGAALKNSKEILMKALRVFIMGSMLVVLVGQYMIHQRLVEAYMEIDRLKAEAAGLRLNTERRDAWKGKP